MLNIGFIRGVIRTAEFYIHFLVNLTNYGTKKLVLIRNFEIVALAVVMCLLTDIIRDDNQRL